jgi:glucose-1-phosphate cytidylyltransferase
MKVVLFCGGLGMRLREASESLPKPMVPVGYRPLLWHLMKYYASFGHRDFVLCLGYKADVIKDYFLHYDEAVSNDFVLSGHGQIELLGSDIEDWRITFVDTGAEANVGTRLARVAPYLRGEEMFLANYADGLSDFPLPQLIDRFRASDAIASFLSVRSTSHFHMVRARRDGTVDAIEDLGDSGVRINGGFFVMRQEIFDYLNEGEELVEEPFQRLIAQRRLLTLPYDGFWIPMDTLKDKVALDAMAEAGDLPWLRAASQHARQQPAA